MDARGRRALTCVLVVIWCVTAVVTAAPAVGAAETGPPSEPQLDGRAAQVDDDPLGGYDEVHVDVTTAENGSAVVTVDYRYFLEGNNDTDEEWESMRNEIESDPEPYLESETEKWNGTVTDGNDSTDRGMELRNPSIETDESTAPEAVGHVVYSFEWTSFAYVEPNLIEAGDSLSGFVLLDRMTLDLSWPEGYSLDAADPSPDSEGENTVTWDGNETEFGDDEPRVTAVRNTTEENATTDSEPESSIPWATVAIGLAAIVALGAVGWLVRDGSDGEPNGGADPDPNGGAEPARSPAPTGGPPAELLSNEERVLRLLEERGGRIKQQDVVAELDWTEAKTSQVVGGLREDDRIDVFRIGRENVLALPDETEE